MSAFKFLEAEDWNALIARVEIIEGMGGAPHTFDSHTDVDSYSEATGDIPRWDGDSWSALAIGSTNDILTVTGGLPVWDSDIILASLGVPIISYAGTLKLQDLGAGDVSLFEDQTTTTDRYLYLYGGNTSNYLRLIHTGVYTQLYTNSGAFYIDTQGSLSVRSQQTDTDMTIRIIPEGTGDTTSIDFRNSESTANHGMCLFRLAGGVASIAANTVGSGTEVNKFMISRVGRMDISFFEDQTTATQRYLSVFGPNSSNYVSIYHDATSGYIATSAGNLGLRTMNAIEMKQLSTNADMEVRLYPHGTADGTRILFKNASGGSYAQMILAVDGAIASLRSHLSGGTQITKFKLASAGLMDVSLFEDETDTTQRYLTIYRPNTAEFLQLGHNGYGNMYSSTGIMNIANDDLILGNPAASNFRIRESSNTWYVSADAGDIQIDSAAGNIHLNSYGGGNVDLFLNQTTATQRQLNIHAPNSSYYGYIYHNTYDVKIGNSYAGRRVDFECAVYVEDSLSLRDGGLLRIYNADNTSYINMQCQAGADSGVGLISCDDGGLDVNPNGPIMLQITGRGNVTLFEEQITATQRAFQVFAPNSTKYIQMYHDGSNGYLNTQEGGIVVLSKTALSLSTGPNEWIYFTAGGIFRWQDKDAGNAERMSLDSATGALTLLGTEGNNTGINTFSTDDTLAGDSDDAIPTEKAVKAYVTSQISGGGTSTLQRHFVMDMQPYDGAVWDYENGAAILIDADTEKVHAEGYIPDGATRFKILVWAEHPSASGSTNIQFLIQGKESGETSPTSYYNNTSNWTSTSANEQIVKDSGWQTLDAGDERIYLELERITAGGTTDIYIQTAILVFELDVGNTIGSSAKTELIIPCQMEPHDGSEWSTANGKSIFMNAADEKVLATGYIPPNTEKIQVLVFAQHPSGSGSTSVTTTIKGQECGTTSTESYATDTSAWTSTLANEQICKTLGWYTTDADQERFFIEIKWNSGTDLHINEVVLNCFTPIVVAGTISNPSDATPADMPDSATAGVSDDVSRADHVHPLTTMINMDIVPEGNATLEFKEKHAIVLDANGELAVGKGFIPDGISRYRWLVWYGHGSAPQNSDVDLYLHDAGDDESANGWNRINATADNWASTTTDDVYLFTSSWFSPTGNFPKAVWGIVTFDTGDAMRLWRMALECDTESS